MIDVLLETSGRKVGEVSYAAPHGGMTFVCDAALFRQGKPPTVAVGFYTGPVHRERVGNPFVFGRPIVRGVKQRIN